MATTDKLQTTDEEDNGIGLDYEDIWYLAEGSVASPAYVWKNWGENSGYTLGNKSGEYDPPATGSPTADDISAGLLRGPYATAGDYDYVIDTDVSPLSTTFPLWQFTWVIIENPTAYHVIIDSVNVRVTPRGGDTPWSSTSSYNKYRNLMSFQILGKWAGVGTGSGCVRNTSNGLYSATNFPLGYVNINGGYEDIQFDALGVNTYTDHYPDGTEMTSESPVVIPAEGVYRPWQRIAYHDSYRRTSLSKYHMILAPDDAAVGVLAFSIDTTSNARGNTATYSFADLGSTFTGGWGINGCQMALRWYDAT